MGGGANGGGVDPSNPVARPAEDAWPKLFRDAPARMQESDRFAVANRRLLRWMPCFCGCVDTGHTGNFGRCVREVRSDGSVPLDSMSLAGGVCVDVAGAALTARPEGTSLPEIRRFVDDAYGQIGATDTSLPPAGR